MSVIHVSLSKGCFLLTLFSSSLVIVNHLETLLEALTYCLLFKRSQFTRNATDRRRGSLFRLTKSGGVKRGLKADGVRAGEGEGVRASGGWQE